MALALPLAACGDDDSSDATAPTAAASTNGSDSADSDTEAEARATIEDAMSGDGQSFGLDLETRVTAIEAALDIEDYSIDGSTLTLEIAEERGSIAAMTACIAAGAVMEESETLVLRFTDGTDETCD